MTAEARPATGRRAAAAGRVGRGGNDAAGNDAGGNDAGGSFEPHRRHLTGLAYRMLGALSEAEDVVQDAYLRWHEAARDKVDNPRAYLSRVVTRLCLDRLKSARARRETYVGPWLPEPVIDEASVSPEIASELAADLSMAFMMALERLSPLERAAFLLHDVFDFDHSEVARTLNRSEAACRQLAARARAHVRDARPRYPVSDEEAERLANAFFTAARSGDADALRHLLAADATLWTDGGGRKAAALNPIHGRDRITRFFAGIVTKGRALELRDVRAGRINGLPGIIATETDGSLYLIAAEVRDGAVTAIYIHRNPDKLRHVTA